MKFKKPRTRIARIMAALVCALGIAAPLSAAIGTPAAQAAVNCTPYLKSGAWYVNYGCKSVAIPASHKCAVVADTTVDGITPIECADIVVTNDDTTNPPTDPFVDMWGEGEFYCQDAAGYTQCGGMNVNVDMSYKPLPGPSVAYTQPLRNYKCNPNPGPACPTSGRAMISTEHTGQILSYCYQTYTWLPKGNIISIHGVALRTSSELDTPKTLDVCFQAAPQDQ